MSHPSGEEREPIPEGPFQRHLSSAEIDLPKTDETEFEKRRGINRVEIRDGLIRSHVSRLAEPIMASRLAVLEALASAKISIDFLKFTATGMSFIAKETLHADLEACLQGLNVTFSIHPDRCILLIHAANMRDEEGLIARLVSEVIASGSVVDQLGDMHDRILLVVDEKDAASLRDRIIQKFMEGAAE